VVDSWRPLAEGAAASLRWLAHTLAGGGDGRLVGSPAALPEPSPEPKALAEEVLEALTATVRTASDAPDAGAEAGSAVLLAVATLAESAAVRTGAAALTDLGTVALLLALCLDERSTTIIGFWFQSVQDLGFRVVGLAVSCRHRCRVQGSSFRVEGFEAQSCFVSGPVSRVR
jgi:hypothetical protein